ncbi:MAG TPA: YdeI/OmpD-associated family protein [Segetibacter sp.]|jgi:hypothetical protein
MIEFSAIIKKFASQGEKTGWTYIDVPAKFAQQLMPDNKRSFRVKGFLDEHEISGIALVPMGGGDFIMALNATLRKQIKKNKGAILKVKLEVDHKEIKPPAELIECLKDEPKAFENYNKLPKSHQHYYTRWIESAKTDATKARRIAVSVTVLARGLSFGEAMRSIKGDREALFKP